MVHMKKLLIFLLLLSSATFASPPPDSVLPVRGFCIAAPHAPAFNEFLKFIKEELVPRQVNTLILRIDYNYQYESHPELRDSSALSKEDIKKLVQLCKQNHINLIPQVNLLGHQSWASQTHNLLRVYPQFDE